VIGVSFIGVTKTPLFLLVKSNFVAIQRYGVQTFVKKNWTTLSPALIIIGIEELFLIHTFN
jgi:hypothetical protein